MSTMKKVLITGAGGFIGSHLTELLIHKGFEVRAMVHYRGSGSWGWLSQVPEEVLAACEIVAGDVRDTEQVAHFASGCTHICHLAALIGIPYSYQAARSYIETNITGTLNVLSAAREKGIHVLQTSTSEVYGSALYVPMAEDHPLQGQSPYSASKIGADMLALSYARSFEMPVTVIRPFNTFGPRQSNRAVIPVIISQLLSAQPEIHLGALSPTRDLNYVLNTASAYHAVMAADPKDTTGEVFNFGTGAEISIESLAKKIMQLLGIEKPISTQESRKRPEQSEVNRLFSDSTKAQRILAWEPQYALTEGLEKTIEWFRTADKALYRGEYAQ
jgi:NAD dependent epimerase/dehydratase